MEINKLKRPKIKNFFPENFGVDKINNTFLANEELYRYMTALDNYIDQLEEVCQRLTDDEIKKYYKEYFNINIDFNNTDQVMRWTHSAQNVVDFTKWILNKCDS